MISNEFNAMRCCIIAGESGQLLTFFTALFPETTTPREYLISANDFESPIEGGVLLNW